MGRYAAGSSSIHIFVYLVICVWIHFVKGKDVIQGRVSSIFFSDVADIYMPTSLEVDVTLDQNDVKLNLQRDNEFRPNLPVYILSTDSSGKEQINRAKLIDNEYAVYHDTSHEAAFGVYRETDSNGTVQYKMEGIVHSEGKIFDLKSTGQTRKRRRRRDVTLANSTRATTPANNGGGERNAKAAGEREEEDEEEVEDFEVNVFEEPAADQADALPKPIFILRRKTMTMHVNMSEPLRMGGSSFSLPRMPSPPVPPPPSRRRRREVTQDIFVDVVALADYGVYKSWYDRSTASTADSKQNDAVTKIRRYYAFIMNGVNMLYRSITQLRYKINVRLTGVVISASPTSSDWTERYRVTAPQWDEVDANSALKAVSDWAATTDLLPPYDHLMVFSGYDLSKTDGDKISDKITGLAYTETVCDTNGKATSIVEDLGGFQCIGTAAHELGHGLSAEHDGTDNACRSEDRYIMSAGTYNVTEANRFNPWKFSTCSVNYFNAFINNEVMYTRGRQCLYSALAATGSVSDVSSLVEGQIYDADSQCRQVYGPESRLCRGPEFGKSEDVCTDMFCYDPTTSATCYQLVAARGTTCGDKKWCESGHCVFNSAAPAIDENCVFGDQPGIAFDGTDCQTFVDNFPGYCYQEVVAVRCCSSCAKHRILLQDCEYGNKATGCQSSYCSRATVDYKESCCGSCNYGTPLTTSGTPLPTTTSTTTTTTTTPKPTTRIASVTDEVNSTPDKVVGTSTTVSTTTTTPITTTTTMPETCIDNTTLTINQMDCQTLAATSSYLCYDSRVIDLCCQSCRLVVSSVRGCEFGDRRPSECGVVKFDMDACSTLQPVCCKSCSGYQSPTGGQPSTASIAGTLLLLCVSVALLL